MVNMNNHHFSDLTLKYNAIQTLGLRHSRVLVTWLIGLSVSRRVWDSAQVVQDDADPGTTRVSSSLMSGQPHNAADDIRDSHWPWHVGKFQAQTS